MKALIYTEPYKLEYSDFPDPSIGDDDILVRVKACGICGSDIQGYTGKTGRRIPPLIMGHEAAGIIEQVGKNVKDFQTGGKVCFDSTVYCDKCEQCRGGLYNRCLSREVLGVSTPDFKRHGALAEFVSVPSWIVSKIPNNMQFTHAALLEPVSIGAHAANRAGLSSEDTIMIMGAGTIGLCILLSCRVKGVGKIIVSDIDEFRLGVAEKLGADMVINPKKTDLKEMVLKETENKGADVTFEAVGLSDTFQAAVSVTKTGGELIAVGNVEKKVQFDLQKFVAGELTFKGSYASSGEFRDCIEPVASGKINVEPLISECLPLSDGPDAFERLLKAEENLLKIVLEP